MPQIPEWSLVVCGGGSGGHLFPALAVVERLKAQGTSPNRVIFLTADRPIDQQVLLEQGVEQHSLNTINSQQLLRKPVLSVQTMIQAIWQARQLLKTLPHSVILGTGGFSSIPGVLAARWKKRPVILLEQNVIPGRATSSLARFAHHLCLSFTETQPFFATRTPMTVTGNPVRQAIAGLHGQQRLPAKQLLVLGGSQGAAAVNEAVLRFVKAHRGTLSNWTLLHQTGIVDEDRIRTAYQALGQSAEVSAFFQNMPEIYQRAGIVVTRAGGTSLAEIACAGIPAIVIPYPRSLRNHQMINARHFSSQQAALLVEQGPPEQFDADLKKALHTLIDDEPRRCSMAAAMSQLARPMATQQVCDRILQEVEMQ